MRSKVFLHFPPTFSLSLSFSHSSPGARRMCTHNRLQISLMPKLKSSRSYTIYEQERKIGDDKGRTYERETKGGKTRKYFFFFVSALNLKYASKHRVFKRREVLCQNSFRNWQRSCVRVCNATSIVYYSTSSKMYSASMHETGWSVRSELKMAFSNVLPIVSIFDPSPWYDTLRSRVAPQHCKEPWRSLNVEMITFLKLPILHDTEEDKEFPKRNFLLLSKTVLCHHRQSVTGRISDLFRHHAEQSRSSQITFSKMSRRYIR